MKRKNKILSFILAVIMLFSVSCINVAALNGLGTEGSPYIISTAADLQNINANVSAYYELANNIDLANADFTPIGNVDSGAFSGVFDGKGYTISNLNVFSGKYAGLFGCNEGTIKNVTLENVYVYGTRYVGGICGENTSYGTIDSCTVVNGLVETDGGIYAPDVGGIVGRNSGALLGQLSNGANVTADCNVENVYIGGIVGYSTSSVSLTDCKNTGNITNDYYTDCYSGGLVGYARSCTIKNGYNSGDIDSYYSGGLVGYSNRNSVVVGGCNTGNVYGDSYAGGIAYETGNVINCYNSGSIRGYYDSQSGIAVYCNTIVNSYNTGNVDDDALSHIYSKITNCYSTGKSYRYAYTGNFSPTYTNNYISSYAKTDYSSESMATKLSPEEMKVQSNYKNWDFEETWVINPAVNSGMPILKDSSGQLMLNIANKTMVAGEELQLKAYKNGTETDDVTWYVSYGNSTVSSSGLVLANSGISTITAKDSQGNKANCNIYVMTESSGITVPNSYCNIGNSSNAYASFVCEGGDFLVNATSDNSDVVSIQDYYDDLIYFTGHSVGTANITAETAQGYKYTFKVTVTNYATSLTLYDITVTKGKSTKISYSVYPYPTSSKITWTSSDTAIATIDENGYITGHKVGSVKITAKTDNGYPSSATVTVKAPIENMYFEKSEVTMYVGDVGKLNLIKDPEDTTDTISYSVKTLTGNSASTYALISSDGTFTAKAAYTVVVTATASSGAKATCHVTIKSIPTIVTDVTLNEVKKEMLVGEAFRLTATISPSNATDKIITWSSSDESVVTITSGGTVEAVGVGKAIITASSSNGVEDYCEFVVGDPNQRIVLTSPGIYKQYDETMTFSVQSETAQYQWYGCNNDNMTDSVAIDGANDSVMLPMAHFGEEITENEFDYYYCVATDDGNEVTSSLCANAFSSVTPTENSKIDYAHGIIYTDSLSNINDYSNIVTLSPIPNIDLTWDASFSNDSITCYGTGSKLCLSQNEEQLSFWELVMFGDLTGDGVVDVLDSAAMAKAVNRQSELSGNIALAADVNSDGDITVEDYQVVVNKSLS